MAPSSGKDKGNAVDKIRRRALPCMLFLLSLLCLSIPCSTAIKNLHQRQADRTIRFPNSGAVGDLYFFRPTDRVTDERGKFFAAAVGSVKVPAGVNLKLVLNKTAAKNVFAALQPGDIQAVSLKNCPADDAWLSAMSHLTGIIEIQAGATDVTDGGLKALSKLPNLRFLGLNETAVTGTGLASLRNLRAVTLMSSSATDEGLRQFVRQNPLVTLRAGRTRVNGSFLKSFPSDNRLEWLDLEKTKITDETLEGIGKFKNLRSLSLRETRITSRGAQNLANLHNLCYLDLTGTDIDDHAISSLLKLKKLSHLELGNTKLTNAAINELSKSTVIDTLDVSRTKIDDSSVRFLQKMPKLRILYISDTAISDKSIPSLVSIKPIELALSNTRLTKQGAATLESQLGRTCRISHNWRF